MLVNHPFSPSNTLIRLRNLSTSYPVC